MVAYRTVDKMRDMLNIKHDLNTTDKFEGSGVYKITCSDCPKYYIGRTEREFKVRFKQHIPRNTAEQKSTNAEHLINSNHKYSGIDNNVQILHRARRIQDQSVLENFEIYRSVQEDGDNVLNDKTNSRANALFNTVIKLKQSAARI